MKFFVMYAQPQVEEYVRAGDTINRLRRACKFSEFQYLDRTPLTVEISDDGGTQFPDFILQGFIPLVSTGLKRALENFGVDYVFFKPIRLTCSRLGISENYFLALPPRINCLDERTVIVDNAAQKISIDEEKIGRFDIFKLAGVTNQEIIVTEKLKAALADYNFENLFFSETE